MGKPKRRESGLKTYAKSTGALFCVTTRIHSSLRLFGLMGGSTRLTAIPVCRELGSTRFSLLQFILGFHSLFLKKVREWVPSSRRHAPHLQARSSLQVKVLLGFITSLSRRKVINCSCQVK